MKKLCLGVDVSKDKLDAALLLDGRQWYATKMGNDEAGVAQLLAWALSKSGLAVSDCRVVMEATGVYHQVAAQGLHDAGCEVVIANPKRVRDYAKGKGLLTKTDAWMRGCWRGMRRRVMSFWRGFPQPRRCGCCAPWWPGWTRWSRIYSGRRIAWKRP